MNPVILSIPIYFVLIGIELLIQYFSGKKMYRISDAITNISCGIVQQISGILFKVLSVGVYTLVYTHLRLWTIEINWITWITLFIGIDFFYYWAHRMSHQINLFWGGHVVHHQSEDYNFSVALRQSSFQVFWTFAFYMPLAIVGFDPITFLFINALTTVYQFWIHTETIGKMGPFELVFNTPSHHRVHHGRNPKYIDRNHAGVFIVWDKLFGTFQKEEETPTYGITTPIKSWNPVWANFDHYHKMWQELKEITSLKNKLAYLFKKPGWLPDELGGYRPPPEVNKNSYHKYGSSINQSTTRYILVQYLIALAVTALFLFNLNSLDYKSIVGISLWIIFSVMTIGGIIEKRKWAVRMEFIRLILFVFALGICIYLQVLLVISIGFLVTGLISLILFINILNAKKINTI